MTERSFSTQTDIRNRRARKVTCELSLFLRTTASRGLVPGPKRSPLAMWEMSWELMEVSVPGRARPPLSLH